MKYQLWNYFTDTVASEHRKLETAVKQYQKDYKDFYKHNTRNTHFCYKIREIKEDQTVALYDGDGMRIE